VHTVVVHRPSDEAVRTLAAEYRAYAVPNRSDESSFADSLRTGIELIASREAGHDATALLICLGDQPLLRLEVLQALIFAWRDGGSLAVRPAYRDSPGEPGHPLLVDRSLWRHVSDLRGEHGLGPVLERHGVNIRTIPVGGRNPDVDTVEDLQALDASAEPATPPEPTPSILDPFDA
jgi:molybdenum cofactor cytidylyltransferase